MNYGDALDYLLFQHDEYTMKPILDEQGRKQLRDEYYIDGINCEPMFFEKECEMVNKKYHKNYRYDEIKSHHYVLSFDPSDKTERGLTGEKAQQLGLEFARKNFPGHQILVVTHTDGHNHSGNIHVHIVLNSVRKETVAEEDFMERPCDHKAGYKHHQTRALLTHLQKSLMELCEREKLHQIDLLSPSASKITQEEYWAQRRGQKNLDEINKQIIEDGYIPTQTNFQTQKQKIRNAVNELAAVSKSFEDFQSQLFEKYKITVIEKRGRYSYHLPEREKNISERSLGTHYGKEYLSSIYGTKTKSITPEIPSMREYDPTYDYQADPITILYIRSKLRLVTDLQTCVKAQQNQAYAHKVTGNHEAWINEQYQELEKGLIVGDVVVLHDNVIQLTKGSETIQIAGLDDPDCTDRDTYIQESMVQTKISNMSLSNEYSILLSHRPEMFEEYVSEEVDLVLSGHAHGGQFRVPFIGGIIAPNQGLFPKFDAGKYIKNNTTMIVSRGIGNSIIPVRFNNRPEIVIVELIRD